MKLRRLATLGVAALCVCVLAGGSALAAGEEIVVKTQMMAPTANPTNLGPQYNNWIDHSTAGTISAEVLIYPTCLKLVNYDEDTDAPVPEAATAMPTVSGGGTIYTFTIATGHRFSDGEPVTAESFRWAIDRAITISPLVAALMPDVVDVTAAGNTLTVTLSAPAGDLVSRLGMSHFCATPSSAPAAFSEAPLAAAGPYYIQSASVSEIVLARNPNYGGTRTQNLGTIRWRPLAAVAADEEWNADYVFSPLGSFTPPAGMTTFSTAATGVEMLFLNTTRAPFSSETARRAVAYAIDRNALAVTDSYVPPLAATDTFLSPLMPGAVDHDVYPLDGSGQATAVSLLGGTTPAVALCYPFGRESAVAAIESQLEAVGFQVTSTGYMPVAFFNTVVPNSLLCDLRLLTINPPYPDPAGLLPRLFHGGSVGIANWSFFDDATFNARLDAANATTDESARLAEYALLDHDLALAAPVVAIGFRSFRDIVSSRIGCTSTSRARHGGFALNRLCIEVSETAPPGGTVSTGGDATPAAPLQSSVTVPDDGESREVSITQGISDASVQPSFALLEQQLDVSVEPAGTVAEPLVLAFELDASVLAAAGIGIADVVVYRNGDPVADCTNPGGTSAEPDPCVASRTTQADGDGLVIVRTSAASRWNFGGGRGRGPFEPVSAQPAVNTMKAGRTVPVKFALGGDFGLNVFEAGYPRSEGGTCGGPADSIETTSTNSSGLQYDATTGTYQYNWKTQSSWKGQCRVLILRLTDGQEIRASFKFN